MGRTGWCLSLLCWLSAAMALPADEVSPYQIREVRGWTVHISPTLLEAHPEKTARAIVLLDQQLAEIEKVVPATAVTELRKVPLWMSPAYPDFSARAEYHPDPGWLKRHGRNPEMARCVEFTNILIFDDEFRRMPNFVLHELAHAFHHRVLTYAEPRILAAFDAAKTSGVYEKVERKDARGKVSIGRHYALTNDREYFAECSEAYFTTNDFFPYRRDELQAVDPRMHDLLADLWGSFPKIK